MDSVPLKNQTKVVEKLNKTTKRIQRARKNTKIAEKEAAEFQEIHKLLESTDESEPGSSETETLPKEIEFSDSSVIPVTLPGLKVFHDELLYSLFKESDCLLKNFVNCQEKSLIFGKNESVPSEECFRKLIAYHVTENLMPEEGSCSSISLYVLYLMSVHQDPDFVTACFDFVKCQRFRLQPEDIFPIFINFGARKDLFEICEESLKKKFHHREKGDEASKEIQFPVFNFEMVGRILWQYITEDLLVLNTNIKPLVKGLVKITLDPKIRSGVNLPLYSTILTTLCAKIQKDFQLEEILSWVHLEEEHLLIQLEICRNISRSLFPDLHESLVLKILSKIIKPDILQARPPIKINHLKTVLKKLRSRELHPLELYSVLLLINSSLPGLTATKKDSTEINTLLAALEQKISKVEDSVDLIRLKLEIAKVGNQVTNIRDNRFTAQQSPRTSPRSSAKKVKCSN